MNAKTIFIGIIILSIIAVGIVLYRNQGATVPQIGTGTQSTPPIAATSSVGVPTAPSQSMGTAVTVSYTSNGFLPATTTVRKGTTVTFVNNSASPMWIASNPHPVHTDYPGFDAGQAIGQSLTYSFTFRKAGTWGYHNHMDPAVGGRIIVTE